MAKIGKPLDPLPRFWSRVDKSPGFGPNGDCWRWTAGTDGRDYGLISINGKNVRAHRYSWELENERPFPAGFGGCHTCDTPRCVNPRHIFPGTASDNAKDAFRKGRRVSPSLGGWRGMNADKTHCKRGHSFTPENTLLRPGKRQCRICQRLHEATRNAKGPRIRKETSTAERHAGAK